LIPTGFFCLIHGYIGTPQNSIDCVAFFPFGNTEAAGDSEILTVTIEP
jgi:hypothetical protein